jgi:acetyltransferase-like isoleucine patch superfamily enzyme
MFKRILRAAAFKKGWFIDTYRRICRPDGYEWAGFLATRGGLAMGRDCFIMTNVTITDPAYVRLGSNVRLSGCTLFGHDGSVNMVNRAYGLKLDRVGPIVIGDNVFIGHGAIILPSITIGSNVIIGAGAVCARDVPPNSVMVGSPARRISSLDELVDRFVRENEALPWRDLIESRGGTFDADIEPELRRRRIRHFFGEQADERAGDA